MSPGELEQVEAEVKALLTPQELRIRRQKIELIVEIYQFLEEHS